MRRHVLALALVLGAGGLCAVASQEQPIHANSAQVRVICPMTVGGSFEAKSSALIGTLTPMATHPPSYAGSLTVDLRTLDTGIDLRTSHMKNEYLEVDKGAGFDVAALSDIRLGEIDPLTFQGRTMFTGNLSLHGARKLITGQADIKRSSGSVRVDAAFPLKLTDYGIAKPQYLGVGVRDQVDVKVSFLINQS